MPIRRWIKTRRTDSVALAIYFVTLAQLGVGFVVVRGVHAQSQEIINDRLANRQQNLDTRVTIIEQMNLSVRLAVLERAADEMGEVRKLIYGVFLSLVGILIAQIVQIRGQRKWRRGGEDDEATA